MTADLKGFKGKFKKRKKFFKNLTWFSFVDSFLVLNLEFTFDGVKQSRQLFVQKHNVKRETDDKPVGKTLFLINIPPYINEPELRSAFRCVGTIETIQLLENVMDHSHDTTTTAATVAIPSNHSKYFGKIKQMFGFKVAYIVFKLTKSLERLLKLAKVTIPETDDNANDTINEHKAVLCTGIEKWTNEYMDSLIDEKGLDDEVNEYMSAFEEREQEEREMAKKVEVDDDGWTVVKRGKTGGFQQKESILKALEDKIEKGKEKKEFNNFYAFQIRQSKQKHIVSLRKRFAQDKLKIEAMKKARRFKPF